MKTEVDEDNEAQAIAFKNMLFAHTWAQEIGSSLYQHLYPEDMGMTEEEERELDWIVPTNQDEATIMLQEFAQEGFVFE